MESKTETPRKIRIVFLIRSLNYGGAERQLLTLIKGIDRNKFDPYLICYYPGGELESEFLNSGIPVIALEKRHRWDILSFFGNLLHNIRVIQPDVLHGYLSMSNVLAVMVKVFNPRIKVVFGVRYAYMDLSQYDLLTRLVYKLEIWLSRYADLIITNSQTGKRNHIRNGFASKYMEVIPNGIDTAKFHISPAEREAFRERLRVNGDALLIGIVGRLDPVKDHPTFLKAMARVIEIEPRATALCVGAGESAYRKALQEITAELKIQDNVIWLDGQNDMRSVYNALDICCSASIGESFSNVIAEALACGCPCVVTDVGDSAVIVDQAGLSVRSGDPEDLARGLLKILRLSERERVELGALGRQRMTENFSVERMTRATEATLINLFRGTAIE